MVTTFRAGEGLCGLLAFVTFAAHVIELAAQAGDLLPERGLAGGAPCLCLDPPQVKPQMETAVLDGQLRAISRIGAAPMECRF